MVIYEQVSDRQEPRFRGFTRCNRRRGRLNGLAETSFDPQKYQSKECCSAHSQKMPEPMSASVRWQTHGQTRGQTLERLRLRLRTQTQNSEPQVLTVTQTQKKKVFKQSDLGFSWILGPPSSSSRYKHGDAFCRGAHCVLDVPSSPEPRVRRQKVNPCLEIKWASTQDVSHSIRARDVQPSLHGRR